MGFFKVVVTFIWELTTLTPLSLNPFSYHYENGNQQVIPPSQGFPSANPWKSGSSRLAFPVDGGSSSLVCEYDLDPAVWEPCNTAQDRQCWLRNKVTGETYDINTDCELTSHEKEGCISVRSLIQTDDDTNFVPPGIVREASRRLTIEFLIHQFVSFKC